MRIGRDAKDTDVLRRFSCKLEDALGKNEETSRRRAADYADLNRQDREDSRQDRGKGELSSYRGTRNGSLGYENGNSSSNDKHGRDGPRDVEKGMSSDPSGGECG